MTISKSTAVRELGLAVSYVSCSAPEAIGEAVEHAKRALRALEDLQKEQLSAGGRALRMEHISAPLGRALERLKGKG